MTLGPAQLKGQVLGEPMALPQDVEGQAVPRLAPGQPGLRPRDLGCFAYPHTLKLPLRWPLEGQGEVSEAYTFVKLKESNLNISCFALKSCLCSLQKGAPTRPVLVPSTAVAHTSILTIACSGGSLRA